MAWTQVFELLVGALKVWLQKGGLFHQCRIYDSPHRWSEAEQLRSEVVGTLKSAKPPPSNITKDERQAIKQLQKESFIMVLGADKGRATVVMEKSEYDEKMCALLSDSKTYEKVDKGPTAK